MSRDFEMTVNFDDAIAMFDGLSDSAKNSLSRPVAQAGAQVFYDAYRAKVPTQTGNLRRAIYQVFSKDNSGGAITEYHVSWNHSVAPHGFNVEYGHGGPRPAPAKGYVRQTYEENVNRALDAMMDRLDIELNYAGL